MRPSLNQSSSSERGTGPNWLPSVVCMYQFSDFLVAVGDPAGALGASRGTEITAWHLGHLVFFPAAVSGALSLALQPGQTTCKGISGGSERVACTLRGQTDSHAKCWD